MAATEPPAVYDELVDLLAENADTERLLSFRLSPGKQACLDALLEKNRRGVLTERESAELDAFEHFEHLVRFLKARLLNSFERLIERAELIRASRFPPKRS